MVDINSRKSLWLENVNMQNFDPSDQKPIWLEVTNEYTGMSHLIGYFQFQKLTNCNVLIHLKYFQPTLEFQISVAPK